MRLEKCTLKAVTDNAFYLTSMQIPFILMHVYTYIGRIVANIAVTLRQVLMSIAKRQ